MPLGCTMTTIKDVPSKAIRDAEAALVIKAKLLELLAPGEARAFARFLARLERKAKNEK